MRRRLKDGISKCRRGRPVRRGFTLQPIKDFAKRNRRRPESGRLDRRRPLRRGLFVERSLPEDTLAEVLADEDDLAEDRSLNALVGNRPTRMEDRWASCDGVGPLDRSGCRNSPSPCFRPSFRWSETAPHRFAGPPRSPMVVHHRRSECRRDPEDRSTDCRTVVFPCRRR